MIEPRPAPFITMSDEQHWYHLTNPFAAQNAFVGAPQQVCAPPAFALARGLLPEPYWDGHAETIACYWRAWELAFANLRRPTAESGFAATYIDTAFFGSLFLWDSALIQFFARYGRRAFDFQRTLDTFYAKQQPDGYICKEFRASDGRPGFERFDPNSTGPNVLAWAEWEHYRATADQARLARVFPALVAYHQWMRAYRTWPDGAYWATGIASGMDNQPRAPRSWPGEWNRWRRPNWERSTPANWPDDVSWLHHGHLAWADATAQALLSARTLLQIGAAIGRSDELPDMAAEAEHLERYLNERLWDEAAGFYLDGRPDGARSDVLSVGAYWALLAGAVPPPRLARFVAHLDDERRFKRPHRVPSLPADHPQYHATGGYWLGSVWPPTTYMILRGLVANGYDALAHAIGENHVRNVARACAETGTLWENYAPEAAAPGNAAQPNFVGWGGLGPIAVLLEHVIGLRPDPLAGRLVWDVRLLEGHGVRHYPFGADGWLDLACAPRSDPSQPPRITASASLPLTLELRWNGDSDTLRLGDVAHVSSPS